MAGGGVRVEESRLDRDGKGWVASSRLWREGLFKVHFQFHASIFKYSKIKSSCILLVLKTFLGDLLISLEIFHPGLM